MGRGRSTSDGSPSTPVSPQYKRGCASRMAMPLTTSATKLVAVTQCVTRTSAECRTGDRLTWCRARDAGRIRRWMRRDTRRFLFHLLLVFLGYFIAGKLGQATTNIRSSNLGPVWPAYGIALAVFLKYGSRVWPAMIASAFLVALEGSVPPLAAAGQATAATVAAATG